MLFSERHDSNDDLIIGAISFSLLTMTTLAVKRVFRVLKRRKKRTMNYREYDSVNLAVGSAAATAPALDQQQNAERSTHCTPSPTVQGDHAFWTAFASEAVLRRDWDSPEEDEAWAHL